jgi:rhodanese-related sulfurtransferase
MELKQLKDRDAMVVIDVMTPEDYAACHIAGARNACVYEMAFLDRMEDLALDRAAPLVVYDATGSTQAAENACDKLLRAGYRSVSILAGGLTAWRSAGYSVDGSHSEEMAVASMHDGNYGIEIEASRLEWIGRNANNRHHGSIAIKGGELIVRNGLPYRGRIEADMTSIRDFDLQDESWNSLLIRHLKSEDFFEVDRFPTAAFELTGWEPLPEATPGTPNGIAIGQLTIKNTSRPIRFPADISPEEDGSLKAHAALDIDRTLWNVNYGSGRLFERLGMHLVHDLISLELFIKAK